MAVTTQPFYEKTEDQKAILEMVRQFVDEQILPNAEHYDANDEFPEPIVEQMKELGPVRGHDPRGVRRDGARPDDLRHVVEELSRGWISISGVVNTHFIARTC